VGGLASQQQQQQQQQRPGGGGPVGPWGQLLPVSREQQEGEMVKEMLRRFPPGKL